MNSSPFFMNLWLLGDPSSTLVLEIFQGQLIYLNLDHWHMALLVCVRLTVLQLAAFTFDPDFKAMTFIGKLLRHCGAFYMQRSFTKDLFYKTIFSEYVHAIMEDGANPIEFFIEGTRSRTGKALHPKMGKVMSDDGNEEGQLFDANFWRK